MIEDDTHIQKIQIEKEIEERRLAHKNSLLFTISMPRSKCQGCKLLRVCSGIINSDYAAGSKQLAVQRLEKHAADPASDCLDILFFMSDHYRVVDSKDEACEKQCQTHSSRHRGWPPSSIR